MSSQEELETLFGRGVAEETGDLVPLPAMPLLAPPPGPDEPSVAVAVERGQIRQRQTREVAEVVPELDELRVGDEVEIPGGRREIITWIDPKRKRIAVGNRRHRTYVSLSEVEELNGRRVADAMNERRNREAREEGLPEPPPVRMPAKIPLPEGLKLFPHQLENVAFITERGRGLIADEMGLGKTISALVCIEAPAVVVCPALLKVNWGREINKWLPDLTVAVINGVGAPGDMEKNADVVVINYDILHAHEAWLVQRRNRTIVADEAHYLKNLDIRWNKAARQHEAGKNSPRRAKSFYGLQAGVPRLLLLTGTPILNRVKELFPLLHMLDSQEWGSGYQFCVRYCAGHYSFLGRTRVFNCNGRSNMDELHERINGVYMMRHTKEAELKNLPAKSRGSIAVSLSSHYAKSYRRARNDFLDWLSELDAEAVGRAMQAEALVKLNKLRSLAAAGKADAAVSHIVDHLESTGRPLVVMGVHREAFELIRGGLDKVNQKVAQAQAKGKQPPISRPIRHGMVVGGQSPAARQETIDAFQNEGTLDVILYSIPIATGTTLTRASDMVFIERMFRPSDQLQAEDRIHRIGQEQKVSITYLDAEGTIDMKLAQLLMEKAETAAAVIDGHDLSAEESAELVLGEMVDFGKSEGFVDTMRSLVENRGVDETEIPLGERGPVPDIFGAEGERFDDYEPAAEDFLVQNPPGIYEELLDEGVVFDSWGDPQ